MTRAQLDCKYLGKHVVIRTLLDYVVVCYLMCMCIYKYLACKIVDGKIQIFSMDVC